LKEPMTYRAQPAPQRTRESEPVDDTEKDSPYTDLSITSPIDNSTLRNNAGNLQITFRVKPALQKSHRINLLIDGAIWQTSRSAGPIQLSNVDRGTHSIVVQITDEDSGKILISSDSIQMTMLRVIARKSSR